ncbi:MAG: copper amine oxidase N-terminal domain-containing protein [Syntrophomonas sp.]
MKRYSTLAYLLVFSLFTLILFIPGDAVAKTSVSIKGGTLVSIENGHTTGDLPAVKGMAQGVLKAGAEVVALIETGQMSIQIENGTFVADSGEITYIRNGEDAYEPEEEGPPLLEEQPAVNPVTLSFNGVTLHPDVPPQIINGRTMVPIAIIASNLGLAVNFNSATQTVTATDGDITLNLVINGNAYKNGIMMAIDVPAMIKDGRTLVPAAFISTAFGAQVSWNEGTRTVSISYQKDETGIISQLKQATTRKIVDGALEPASGLSAMEAIMYLQLASETDLNKFLALSEKWQKAYINESVQEHWGDVIGVEHCYARVTYKDKVYAEADISYQMSNASVKVTLKK